MSIFGNIISAIFKSSSPAGTALVPSGTAVLGRLRRRATRRAISVALHF